MSATNEFDKSAEFIQNNEKKTIFIQISDTRIKWILIKTGKL